jgi:hypothetical protein
LNPIQGKDKEMSDYLLFAGWFCLFVPLAGTFIGVWFLAGILLKYVTHIEVHQAEGASDGKEFSRN